MRTYQGYEGWMSTNTEATQKMRKMHLLVLSICNKYPWKLIDLSDEKANYQTRKYYHSNGLPESTLCHQLQHGNSGSWKFCSVLDVRAMTRTQVARFAFEGGTITTLKIKIKRRVLSGLPVAVDLFCALSISNKHPSKSQIKRVEKLFLEKHLGTYFSVLSS